MAISTFELLNSFAWHAVQIYGHFFTFELQVWPSVIDVILLHDTSSNDCEQMYQVFLKSHNKWHSYGLDKIIYGHFWPLNSV